ncbi:Clp protease N-terminal domain-containing protein [Rhodococcus opacus]|uniref:Clp protease N-terminal domain-containing protein n=1 Tax=Rhodococcus opacus TaxID=37919 RepID=UPI0024BAB5C2|nr:Clp protease N-terminal domain-containing protein [Rhodococcus opacus]MDJ0420866.1 Clp protease N-terminal domain-containing protein [Rhodococcus opacus]
MVFERFSDQARQVVVLAAGAARTHHQNSVGTEHLLVGILDGSLRQTAPGTKRIGTDHLHLALLDDPASTGAQILTDLASLPISEMREHLRRELAQQPTPGPAHRIPIRLSNDEYTRAHAAARTAGQNLETSDPRPHHRRPQPTRIAGSVADNGSSGTCHKTSSIQWRSKRRSSLDSGVDS